MLLLVLFCILSLPALGQQENDDWVDPYDMINYDSTTKTMRKPPQQPVKYDLVEHEKTEHTQQCDMAEVETCAKQVGDLQREVEHHKRQISQISQKPTCSPVFKRFLSRLMKEIKRVGVPSDSTDIFYDAKVKASKQTMTELQSLLEGEERWRTGALDNVLSQILVDFKQHNQEIWKWRFEHSFGVELDTVLKIGLVVLLITAVICTELWSLVSWFVQLRRFCFVLFVTSFAWNWFYIYKSAFAEHQSNIVKMHSFNDKCTGVEKIDWVDNLKEFFRRTLTLQDDPCKKYYEAIMINPIWLAPPHKALSMTITTFFTEPLKHIGQGISEFLQALLKDLPIFLQIPVLLTVMLSIVVILYTSVNAAFRHGIMAPLRGPPRDPPPPGLEQQRRPELEHEQHPQLKPQRLPSPSKNDQRDPHAAGDAPLPRHEPRPRQHGATEDRLLRNEVHQRRPDRSRVKPVAREVETLRTAEPRYSEDEADTGQPEENPEEEEQQEEELGNTTVAPEAQDAAKAGNAADKTESAGSKSNKSPLKDDVKDGPNSNKAAATSQLADKQLRQNKVQDLGPSDFHSLPPVSVEGTNSM